MMTQTRQITRAHERGHTQVDWLDGWHSFSFGNHYDSERMGFGVLRVVNDDRIAPGGGFPSHPHKDMEIVTVVLEGKLEHKDSMGNGSVIEAGEIQYMSAGTGVVHSEFNPSSEQAVHLMQIWIEPEQLGLAPLYADKTLAEAGQDGWRLLLSADGRDGSLEIRQNAELRSAELQPGSSIRYQPSVAGRGLWLFVIGGEIKADGETFGSGDSLALTEVEALSLEHHGALPAQVLLFDVPM